MALDREDRCWIHDGHTNQIIGFDKDFKEKVIFDGICFNQCGFASTDATFALGADKMYWHKGKGILSCVVFKEEKEVEFADIITDSIYVRKIEVDSREENLVCLDSDFSTFHIYDLKKQHRYTTWAYKNDQVVDPKVYCFKITIDNKFIVVAGDCKYVGEDKKKKREAFLAVHKINNTFEHVHTKHCVDFDKHFVSMCRDEESGVMMACDYGKDMIVFRCTDEKLQTVQVLKDIHVDYPFYLHTRENRLYTCSLSQKVSVIEFSLDN